MEIRCDNTLPAVSCRLAPNFSLFSERTLNLLWMHLACCYQHDVCFGKIHVGANSIILHAGNFESASMEQNG